MTQKNFFNSLKAIATVIIGAVASLFFLLIFTILILRWANPPFTAFTLQESWEELQTEPYNLKEWWVPASQIPDHLQWAVIASEDQLFRDHSGFDIESIKEALDERREGERNRGASTITQQTAKNLFLWPNQSFFRKGLEAVLTVVIEILWPKERILEVYLNIAEFGPGLYGVGKTADSKFGVQASGLEPEMSARLAAVLPSPKRMRIEPPSPFAQKRSRWILKQMTQLSGIAYLPDDMIEQIDEIDPFNSDSLSVLLNDATLFDSGADTVRIKQVPDSLLNITPDTSLQNVTIEP